MRLSLATRIFLGYAAVLVTFALVSTFSVVQMHQNQVEIQLVSQGYLSLSLDTSAIHTLYRNLQKHTEALYEEGSAEKRRVLVGLVRRYVNELPDQMTDAQSTARRIREFAPASEQKFIQELEQKLVDLRTRYGAYERTANQVLIEVESGRTGALASPQIEQMKQLETSIGTEIRFVNASVENRIRERVSKAEERERRTGLLIIGWSVFAIVVGLLATAFSTRTLRPVKTLIEAVSRIGRGDYSTQLGVRGDDEISVLAREFDKMATSLKDREAQLKEKQEALLRAEQLAAVGRISAQIAHEVRNPLSSIGLNVELLQEALGKGGLGSSVDARESRDVLASIVREVDRLAEITEGYLRMARLPKPSMAPEDLNEVVGSVLEFSREELERSNVKVIRRLDPAGPRALADEGQLRQVFLNLLRNSREAMPGGGQLIVESRTVNGEAEVVFCDSGRGMTSEVREHIFEPFFSTKEGGTGLGLAVSQQILQAHGGSIRCENSPEGGTTFVVRLPKA
ncbi:MAG TPA: ATP-binding protein [Myxococcaceae bacterium]|nr:ATP-binding protein [Myxococcaceae bacterium]